MSQLELLKKTINFLNTSNIEYMLTGSMVSSIQGEPRSTHDIDIIINIKEENINKLFNFFLQPNFYLDKDSIIDAIKNNSMFNLINTKNGDKVDFWIYTDSEFDKSRFNRKYKHKFQDIEISISSPEDTIIAKLNWAKISGGSKKHIIDALRVYEVQSEIINNNYLLYWIKKMKLQKEWKELLKQLEQ